MATGATEPKDRSMTAADGREVCVMESPIDRNDRLFRELREREADESDTPARLTRPQFYIA